MRVHASSPSQLSLQQRGTGVSATAAGSGRDVCVTVFGFTPDHAGHVLSELGSCGTIVRRASGAGNWIHLQFASHIEAQRVR